MLHSCILVDNELDNEALVVCLRRNSKHYIPINRLRRPYSMNSAPATLTTNRRKWFCCGVLHDDIATFRATNGQFYSVNGFTKIEKDINAYTS